MTGSWAMIPLPGSAPLLRLLVLPAAALVTRRNRVRDLGAVRGEVHLHGRRALRVVALNAPVLGRHHQAVVRALERSVPDPLHDLHGGVVLAGAMTGFALDAVGRDEGRAEVIRGLAVSG